jgi:5-methylcytosine-specific restriction endonuclease McrA
MSQSNPSYTCAYCGRLFVSQQGLYEHLIRRHKKSSEAADEMALYALRQRPRV